MKRLLFSTLAFLTSTFCLAQTQSFVPTGPKTKALSQSITRATDEAAWPMTLSGAPAVTISGSVTVTGIFWQAIQPVSGTVNIGNLPGTQPVSGTFWQAIQPVNGTVSVGNFPAVQNVSGTVATGLLQPVTDLQLRATPLPVSGTVGVSNLPAVQPISATALPLPSGAATSAAQTTANNSLGTIATNTANNATTANQTTGNASLASIDGKITAVNTGNVTIGAALPSGANTIGKVGIDPASNGVVANPPVVAALSGSLSATGTGTVVSADLRAYPAAILTLTGTWTGTVTFQSGGNDSTFASPLVVNTFQQSATSVGILTTVTSNNQVIVPGGCFFRAQLTIAGTGAVSATLQPLLTPPVLGGSSVTATQGGTWSIIPVPNIAQGPTGYYTLVSAAGSNATVARNSGAVVSGLFVSNTTASWRFVKVYNQNTAPTVGTTVPILNLPIPPNSTIDFVSTFTPRFTTGIALAITGGSALLDATAVAAGDVIVNIVY